MSVVTFLITNLIDLPAPLPELINDPVNRVFRGISPVGAPLDRVEVVHFPNRGRFLVICAVLPHFNDGMYGWVRVIR